MHNYIQYDNLSFEEQQRFIWGYTKLNQLLVRAYNIIFNEKNIAIGGTDEYKKIVKMTPNKKNMLNSIIKSALDLAAYNLKEKYTKEFCLKVLEYNYLDINVYLVWGMSEYIYDNISMQPNFKAKLQEEFIKTGKKQDTIFYIPAQIKSEYRRKFKKTFNAYPEQIYAATVYYLMNFIISTLKDSEIEKYGCLIMSCEHLLRLAEDNSKNKNKNFNQKQEIKKELEADYKCFIEEVKKGKYHGMSYDDKIDKIKRKNKVSEKIAKNFHKRARISYKQYLS